MEVTCPNTRIVPGSSSVGGCAPDYYRDVLYWCVCTGCLEVLLREGSLRLQKPNIVVYYYVTHVVPRLPVFGHVCFLALR